MRIESINQSNIDSAAIAFSESWRHSHKGVVNEEFRSSFTPERQKTKLQAHITKGHSCFVAFSNQKTIGILILDMKTNKLISIYVSPNSLKKGYGSKFIDFALDKLDRNRQIKLTVMNINKNARKFYEKRGFEFSGETRILSEEKGLSEMTYIYRGL